MRLPCGKLNEDIFCFEENLMKALLVLIALSFLFAGCSQPRGAGDPVRAYYQGTLPICSGGEYEPPDSSVDAVALINDSVEILDFHGQKRIPVPDAILLVHVLSTTSDRFDALLFYYYLRDIGGRTYCGMDFTVVSTTPFTLNKQFFEKYGKKNP